MGTTKYLLRRLPINRNRVFGRTNTTRWLQNRRSESNANLASPLRALGAMIIIVLMIFAVSQPAANAQAPDYELSWVDNVFNPGESLGLKDINDAGIVVGSAAGRAMLYNYDTKEMRDLNVLTTLPWIERDDQGGSQQTSSWKATSAWGINERDQIVGNAKHIPGEELPRVFLLNDPLGPAPQFILLPRFGGVENRSAAINDLGVVVGYTEGQVIVFDQPAYFPIGIPNPVDFSGYRDLRAINNHGDIVTRVSLGGGGYVISPNGNFNYEPALVTHYPEDEFFGINDSKMISGLRHWKGGRPSERHDGGPIRYQYPGTPGDNNDLLLPDSQGFAYFADVNEEGDVCFAERGRGWVYLESEGAAFNLDLHIEFDSQQDEEDWMNSVIQPWGINDNGQIIIRTSSGYRKAILTQIVPGPGISVTPASGLSIAESGGQDSFNVVLDTQPTADVTLTISSDMGAEGTVSPASLIFTTTNWDSPQPVTATALDDDIQEGDVDYVVTLDPASADQGYAVLNSVDVRVTILDDDFPPVSSETYSRAYSPPDYLPIPDNDATGVSSDIVAGNHVITNLTVTLNINHARYSDLEVWLSGPDPAKPLPQQLSEFSGDNVVPYFDGSNSSGTWTLEVIDTKKRNEGELIAWSITVDY